MAFTITRIRALDVTRIEFEGRLDRDHLLEGVRAARGRPDHNFRTLLVAKPGTEIDLPRDDLKSLADSLRSERPSEAPYGCTAIVVPDDLAFGLARMAQVFMEENPAEVQVFSNEEDASVWILGLPRE